MSSYIAKRVLLIIPTILIVSLIVFVLQRSVPGTAIDIIQSQLALTGDTIDRDAVMSKLGMDKPLLTQYFDWIVGIVTRGDFGTSIFQGKPVMRLIASRIPATFELGLLSIIYANLFGLPLGVLSAARQGRLTDNIIRPFSVLLISIPSFLLATIFIIYTAKYLGWAPSPKLISFIQNPWGNIVQYSIPAIINGAAMAGMTMRMSRTQMMDVVRQDYMRTAWSKGLPEKTVIVRHGLKNALIPVITVIGGQLANVIGGTVIMENIFNIPGMGQLMVEALNSRDYPIVSAIVLLISFSVLVVNVIVDISYSWIDPRVRYSK